MNFGTEIAAHYYLYFSQFSYILKVNSTVFYGSIIVSITNASPAWWVVTYCWENEASTL